jgi:hypothetical protein
MAKILVEYSEVTKLSEIFSVSRVTVTNAIRNRTNSELAKQIRAMALIRGGRETDK